MESYTFLEDVVWRIPKGLPEHVVLILHYEIPVKKRTSFMWKSDEEDESYEGTEYFIEKTPQSHLRAIEYSRRNGLKTINPRVFKILNSFEWHRK